LTEAPVAEAEAEAVAEEEAAAHPEAALEAEAAEEDEEECLKVDGLCGVQQANSRPKTKSIPLPQRARRS
jgi:hypothetical protein